MKKNVPVLLALLVILLAAWWWLGSREEARQRGDAPERATQVDSLTVDRMVLERHNQPRIVFERDAGGVWRITEPLQDRANENFANQMQEGLATMVYLDRVSSRTGQHASFQVDDLQAAHITAYAGESQQADLYIGKITPDRQHVYVRPAGSDAVYTASGGGAMAALRTRALKDFRDRIIFRHDETAYDSLDVQGAVRYRVARADTSSWNIRLGDGAYRAGNGSAISMLVRSMARLNATDFADDSLALAWEQPELTVTAWRLGGQTDVLHFQKVADEENYWLKVEGRPHVYKVFKSGFENFKREVSQLLPAPSGS